MKKPGTSKPHGHVVQLASLADYQADAVVSHEIIRQKAGTVTLFAFDKGQGLSEHTAPFDALVQVIDGAAEITLGGTAHRLATGQMLIMPAGVPHALTALRPFKMLLTMIRS